MYSEIETGFSRRYLSDILKGIPQPPCLIGGWAVYNIVNDSFKERTGREYLGSRDIDLGFHLNPGWNAEELRDSSYCRAVAKIKEMHFEEESYRFVKRYHVEEQRELTEEEARRLPQYQIFNLYIDLLVDSDDPRRHQIAGFTVLEEPLLADVFTGEQYIKLKIHDVEVLLPKPELLMKIKAKSFPDRPAEDKKVKDLIDLCALLLHSKTSPPSLQSTEDRAIKRRFQEALSGVTEQEWDSIASALDLSVQNAKRVTTQITA